MATNVWRGLKRAVLDWIYVRNSEAGQEYAVNAADEVQPTQGQLTIQKRPLTTFEKTLGVVIIAVPAAFFIGAVTLAGVYTRQTN